MERQTKRVYVIFLLFLGIASLIHTENKMMNQVQRWLPVSSTPFQVTQTQRLTLPEITQSFKNYSCPEGLVYIHDTILPDYDSPANRLIPRVIHMTAKSRCLTPTFAKNVQQWRFPDHSLFFHDDDAIERFVSQGFDLFPHFSLVLKCITSGAAKADLWRYLMIWQHGGIYTDFDNAPAEGFQQGMAIKDTDDAWFPLESLGVVAQYFFAASPRHPLMYFSLHSALTEIWRLDSIHNNRAPYTTGPHATKMGTIDFLRAGELETNGYIPAGLYLGTNNRTLTVVGNKTNPQQYVQRSGIPGPIKKEDYEKMGMTHFSSARGTDHHSCVEQILLEYTKRRNATMLPMLPLQESITNESVAGINGNVSSNAKSKKRH